MPATLLPYTAAAIALLRAWVVWMRMPRGAGGLLFQYGALAALNIGLLVMGTDDGWAVAGAAIPVAIIWLAPPFLEQLAGQVLRLGKPAPMRWMLALRFLIAWHRRHLMDVMYLPVRILRAAGRHDQALAVAQALRDKGMLKGLEHEQMEEYATCLWAARRYSELCESGMAAAAAGHAPIWIPIAMARSESGDFAGAAQALHAADAQGLSPLQVNVAWAQLLAAAGEGKELATWVVASGLAEHPGLGPLLERIAKRAAQPPAGMAAEVPQPPYDAVAEQAVGQAIEQRLRTAGPATRVVCWVVVVAWLMQWLAGAEADEGIRVAAGAIVPPFMWAGQGWRAIACTLLHASWLHFAMNALSIPIVGARAEALIGGRQLITAWVVGGLGGAAGTTLTDWLWSDGTPIISVGASGALFGLVGLVIVVLLRKPPLIPARVRRLQLTLFLAVTLMGLGYGLFEGRVDNGAHIGGLLAGALLGLIVPPSGVQPGLPRPGWMMVGAVAASASVVSIGVALVAAVGGGGLPSRMTTKVVDAIHGTRLEVPDWWTVEGSETLVDPYLRLVVEMRGRDVAGADLDAVRREYLAGSADRFVGTPLVSPEATLPSGVVRLVVDATVAYPSGPRPMRWLFYRATFGGRESLVIVGGSPATLRIYGHRLDDLAAQTTPRD